MKFSRDALGEADDVWVSGWWRIPNPRRVYSSRLMNLGHFEGDGDRDNSYLGLESVKRRTMQVVFAPYGAPLTELLPPRRIPNNRWFQVDLHFVLSPVAGDALTEWYMDGELVGSTTASNMYNAKPLTFFNAGVSYFWPGNGGTTVFFDDPKLTY